MTTQPPQQGSTGDPETPQPSAPWEGGTDSSSPGWAYPQGIGALGGGRPIPPPQPNVLSGQWQPGYGPQPGGDGQAPGGGWQSGYGQQPGGYAGWTNQPPRRRNRGCLIVAILLIVAVLVGAGGCAVVLVNQVGPAIALEMDIQGKSGGQITGANYQWTNGVGTFTFTLAADVNPVEAKALACNVIKPAMKGTKFESDRFIVIDGSGRQVVSDRTPCT